eukprot:CAMPEP_0115598590 /NCGR_PEP_ID=MMETSP0272-20121206/13954_1 /TAXON_ID=71861 /ORGANISM="Scrippsiella trochoidea, Strain CCMP3099" /LENGTH=111 /DNA_ID=CAMNT_0003034013 /DNA_START=326 /DNA_END=661 /DNA_ORIENTATION=+
MPPIKQELALGKRASGGNHLRCAAAVAVFIDSPEGLSQAPRGPRSKLPRGSRLRHKLSNVAAARHCVPPPVVIPAFLMRASFAGLCRQAALLHVYDCPGGDLVVICLAHCS